MSTTIGITMGDVNGIGPEILCKALARKEDWGSARIVVYGSESVLSATRKSMGVDAHAAVETFVDCGIAAPAQQVGAVTAEAGDAAMRWLDQAIEDAKAERIQAIVTCPISKEAIRLAGYECMGHTDRIADKTGAPTYYMSLFADAMRAVHVSGHLPLRAALDYLTPERIAGAIRAADEGLRRLGVSRRIAVAGLNPHAGENGIIGDEEQRIVIPAIETCAAECIECSGPYPPDTVFRRMRDGEFDLVVALYHDQGHIPMKLVAMETGVNVTLGIPIIRTSVDHGTAFDIAGRNIASETSLVCAIRLAIQFAESG